MKNKVADILGKADLPAMICVAKDVVGNEDGELNVTKFSDASSDKRFTVLSNIDDPHSPVTAEKIAPESGAEVETASTNRKETLAALCCVASCLGCNHDTFVSSELAAELDGQTFFCMSCGGEVEAYYDADLMAEQAEGDDMEEDDSTDVVDAIDEEDDVTDEDTDVEDTDVTEEDVTDEEESLDGDVTEEEEDVSEEDESEETTDEDTDVEEASAEAATEEVTDSNANSTVEQPAGEATVVIASVASYDESLRFASLSDTARFEVFLGNDHIGSVVKDEASAQVQPLFGKVDVLRNAFGASFWKNSVEIASGNVDSLKDYGFRAAKVTIPLEQVVASEIEALATELETKNEEKIAEAVDAVTASMKVAMAGIDKGIIAGPALTVEIAKLLTRFGVQSPLEVASRFTKQYSAPFFEAVVTASDDLRKKSADYVSGLSHTIEKAAYSFAKQEEDASFATASIAAPKPAATKPVAAPVVEKASAEQPASRINQYAGVFSRMHNRRN